MDASGIVSIKLGSVASRSGYAPLGHIPPPGLGDPV